MKNSYKPAAALLIGVFVIFFAVSFAMNSNYPMKVVAGEQSPATWMSGVLLTGCAMLSLVIGMRRGWSPWFLFFTFFVLLAMDEHFMFHEKMKDQILFSMASQSPKWLAELPVMIGAAFGCVITYVLWKNIHEKSRMLLIPVLLLGAASVIIDIMTIGVFWEECCKLVAELLMALVLLRNVERE